MIVSRLGYAEVERRFEAHGCPPGLIGQHPSTAVNKSKSPSVWSNSTPETEPGRGGRPPSSRAGSVAEQHLPVADRRVSGLPCGPRRSPAGPFHEIGIALEVDHALVDLCRRNSVGRRHVHVLTAWSWITALQRRWVRTRSWISMKPRPTLLQLAIVEHDRRGQPEHPAVVERVVHQDATRYELNISLAGEAGVSELDADEQAAPADVGHQPAGARRRVPQPREQLPSQIPGPAEPAFSSSPSACREAAAAAAAMGAPENVDVWRNGYLVERPVEVSRRHCRRDWNNPTREALPDQKYVRHDSLRLHGEPPSRAAQPGQHLVDDQQAPVVPAHSSTSL